MSVNAKVFLNFISKIELKICTFNTIKQQSK